MSKDLPGFSAGPKFWQSLTPEEEQQVCDNDFVLTGKLAERMWRMGEMQGEPPERLIVLVNVADVERLIREEKKEKRRRR